MTDGSRPRITVITNGNYFSNLGLAPILHAHASDYVFQIIRTHGLRKQRGNRIIEAARLFRRWGVRYSLYKVFTLLLPGVASVLTRSDLSVAQTCKRLGIPCLQTRNVNHAGFLTTIADFAPDLIISFSCPYKLKPSILSIPRLGCINVHSSLLPKYAGVCTYVHALADRCTETGVTVHEMVERIDAGNILAQERVPIPPNCSVFSLFSYQCRIAAELLDRTVRKVIHDDAILGIPQDSNIRNYCGEPTSGDIRRLFAAGFSLFRFPDLKTIPQRAETTVSPDRSMRAES